jgi:hypothetical protein
MSPTYKPWGPRKPVLTRGLISTLDDYVKQMWSPATGVEEVQYPYWQSNHLNFGCFTLCPEAGLITDRTTGTTFISVPRCREGDCV